MSPISKDPGADPNELGKRLDSFFNRDASDVVADAERILGEAEPASISALPLSKQAAEVSWRLMRVRERPEPATRKAILNMASLVCDAIEAANALVTEEAVQGPAVESVLGAPTRRMLVSQRSSLAPTIAAVRNSIGKMRTIVQRINKRSTDPDLAQLQRYFACLATVLQEVSL